MAEITEAVRPDVVVASSSSGLPSSKFISKAKNPERVLIGHPFNPPHLMPLVEIVGHPGTSPQAIDRAKTFYNSVGKRPIVVKQETPGFVANRLQAALINEAYSLVSRGVLSAEDLGQWKATYIQPREPKDPTDTHPQTRPSQQASAHAGLSSDHSSPTQWAEVAAATVFDICSSISDLPARNGLKTCAQTNSSGIRTISMPSVLAWIRSLRAKMSRRWSNSVTLSLSECSRSKARGVLALVRSISAGRLVIYII